MDEQMDMLSLFAKEEKTAGRQKLDVVQMEYKQAQSVTWQELFSGYDKIRAITYSSGINFFYQLL